jgi:hypothetical protein
MPADVSTLDTSTAELLPPAEPLLAERGSTWLVGSPRRIDRCFRARIHSEAGRIGAGEVMRLS